MSRPEDEFEVVTNQSDEVIAKAFRWSLGFLSVAAAVAMVIVFWPHAEPPPPADIRPAEMIRELAQPELELPQLPFELMNGEAGIEWSHFSGANGEKLLPETMGGGVAIFDYNGDRQPDLLFVSGMEWPSDADRPAARRLEGSALRLYANRGDWKFDEVTVETGLTAKLYGMGCAVGDVDNDGWDDLFVSCVGKNRFFHNDQGRFVDATEEAGLAGPDEAWSSSAGFFDYDRDGLLDLLVCNYVQWSREIDFELNFTLNGTDRAYGPPTNYSGTQVLLYRNLGDGKFAEVGEQAGVHVVNSAQGVPEGKGLALLLADLNADGWDDVFVANDKVRNFLFLNNGDGTFREEGVLSGVAYDRAGGATGAMGVDLGHVFNDDCQAVAIGNFANEMTSVYLSQPDTSFVDESATIGIGAPSRQYLKFGVLWLDLDLDGRLDLVAANGHLEETISEIQPSQTYRQSAQVFWNKGLGDGVCFVELPQASVGDLSKPIVGRGLASGDLDGDGDLDLVLTQIDGPPLVLRNAQDSGHSFLQFRLQGTQSNRSAFGTRVELKIGEQRLTQILSPTRSYLSQVESLLTFGLGEQEVVDEIRVRWPSGAISQLEQVPANQLLELTEPAGQTP